MEKHVMGKKLAAAIAAFTISSVASAGTVYLYEAQEQTVAGQDFEFSFSGLEASSGTGLLEFLIRGDFSIGASLGESFSYDIDSVVSDSGIQATTSNLLMSYGADDTGGDDNLFKVSQVISATDLTSILSDGMLTVSVDFASGVNLNLETASISTMITYSTMEVPLPAALPLFGLSLASLGFVRRKYSTVKPV